MNRLYEHVLLLEYDMQKTLKQHGDNLVKHIKSTTDDHPMISKLRETLNNPHTSSNTPEQDENYAKGVVVKHLESLDPSPQKKHVPAMARIYSKGGVDKFEDMGRLANALHAHHELSKRGKIPVEHRDAGRIKTLTHAEDLVDKYSEHETENEKKDAYSEKMKSPEHSTITDHPEFTQITPHTAEAAKHFGKGTRWCTAASNNNMFNYYHKDGPLHILVPKKPNYPGEKYQYHYSSSQYMNEKDRAVRISDASYNDWADPGHPAITKWQNDYREDCYEASHSPRALDHHEPRVALDYVKKSGHVLSLEDKHKAIKMGGQIGFHVLNHSEDLDSSHIDAALMHKNKDMRVEGIQAAHRLKIKPSSDALHNVMKRGDGAARLALDGIAGDHDLGITKEHVTAAIHGESNEALQAALDHPNADRNEIKKVFNASSPKKQGAIARLLANPKDLEHAQKNGSKHARWAVAQNKWATPTQMQRAAKDEDPDVRIAAATNPHMHTTGLRRLVKDADPRVKHTARAHPQSPVKPIPSGKPMYPAGRKGGVPGEAGFHKLEHVPGDKVSDEKLRALKSLIKNHNATSENKHRLMYRGRLGKGNPDAKKLSYSQKQHHTVPGKLATRFSVYARANTWKPNSEEPNLPTFKESVVKKFKDFLAE